MLEQEAQIAKFAETEGLSRPQAIRRLVSAKPGRCCSEDRCEPCCKPKTAEPTKVKEAADCHRSEAKKEEVSVEYGMYIWYGLSDSRVRRAVATLAAKIELSPPLLLLLPQNLQFTSSRGCSRREIARVVLLDRNNVRKRLLMAIS
jgi:hypothetical protein